MDENNQSKADLLKEPKPKRGIAAYTAKKRAKRLAKRRAERDAFDQAGLFGRTWIVLKNIIKTLFSIAILAAIVFGVILLTTYLTNQSAADALFSDDTQITEEEILAFSPIDQQKAASIDAMPQYSKDDTWSIYLYFCGSNLEGGDVSELSGLVDTISYNESAYNDSYVSGANYERVRDYIYELSDLGMALPEYFYETSPGIANKIESGATPNPLVQLLQIAYAFDDTPSKGCCASKDIQEILSVQLPDNVQVIIQTGGSKSWDLPNINPNRIERYLYNSKGITLIDDLPTQSMSEQGTVEDFLNFCKNGYSADHQMLVFWDHGAGPFGFCHDDIFGGNVISLAALRAALENVYPEPSSPPFEIIGFDACLMATVEVAKTLEGYGKYLFASQEIEPGDGWAHQAWLSAIAENPAINGAQVGKAMADGFMEFYAKQDKSRSTLFGGNETVTISVTDIEKAAAAYDAYEEFAGKLLTDSFRNPSVLAAIGGAAANSVRYANDTYDIYNLVDMALFMDNLSRRYESEASAIAKAVRDSVLYSRASTYEKDSQGLSVYVPVSIAGYHSLNKYLEYVNNVCLSPNIQSLYYYKLSGCLNEELQQYADEAGFGKATKLDTKALKSLSKKELQLDGDGNFSIELPNNVSRLVQDSRVELARYDKERGEILYYGRDTFCGIDGELLYTEFDGQWVAIDGRHFYVELFSATPSFYKYRARALVNNKDSFIILGYDRNEKTFSVVGVTPAAAETIADTAHRSGAMLLPGDTIAPVYPSHSVRKDDRSSNLLSGASFVYDKDSVVADAHLEDGTYVLTVVITDPRGDEYYTPVVELTYKDSKLVSAVQSNELYGKR